MQIFVIKKQTLFLILERFERLALSLWISFVRLIRFAQTHQRKLND